MTPKLSGARAPLFSFSPGSLRRMPVRGVVIRFVFGAVIAAIASGVSILAGLRTGGLLLAFPAILPATLTLIEEEESVRKAISDDLGSILGAIGLAAFALVAWWLLPRQGAPVALVAACGAWLVTALALYVTLRAVRAARRRQAGSRSDGDTSDRDT